MQFTKEMLQQAQSATSAEELMKLAKGHGIELSETDAEACYNFLNSRQELSDEELSQVTGGKEGKHCTTAPTLFCTGSGFLCGLDACSNYYETADPNSKATPYTYPVLCYCRKGHFSDFPMNRPYDA